MEDSMKVNYFKVIGMIGMLAEELNQIAEDGKVTINEALGLMEKICEQLGLDFDRTGLQFTEAKEPAK